MTDRLGNLAREVQATLREIAPALGTRVDPRNPPQSGVGSGRYQIYGYHDWARQRYEDVVVDLVSLGASGLVTASVERGTGHPLMAERVVYLEGHSGSEEGMSSVAEFLDALRTELPTFLATPFDVEGP